MSRVLHRQAAAGVVLRHPGPADDAAGTARPRHLRRRRAASRPKSRRGQPNVRQFPRPRDAKVAGRGGRRRRPVDVGLPQVAVAVFQMCDGRAAGHRSPQRQVVGLVDVHSGQESGPVWSVPVERQPIDRELDAREIHQIGDHGLGRRRPASDLDDRAPRPDRHLRQQALVRDRLMEREERGADQRLDDGPRGGRVPQRVRDGLAGAVEDPDVAEVRPRRRWCRPIRAAPHGSPVPGRRPGFARPWQTRPSPSARSRASRWRCCSTGPP